MPRAMNRAKTASHKDWMLIKRHITKNFLKREYFNLVLIFQGYTSDTVKNKFEKDRKKVAIMKLDFLKKLNTKVVTIVAVIVVLVVGCGTALAIGLSHQARSAAEITEQEAKAIVFSDAGIAESDVLSLKISKDKENGADIYDIDFTTKDRSYDYDVLRNSGEIIHSSYEVLSASNTDDTQNGSGSSQSASSNVGAESAGSTSSQTNGETNSSAGTASAITQDQAKTIALEDAGVQESDAQFIRVQEDYDDGRAVYEIEFYANGTEYDYEIAKDSGAIVKCDYDIENYTPQSGAGNSGTIISLEQAQELALSRVSGATASNIRIHLDHDDGRQIYEGEIYYNWTEYEFEIDASTGNFIEWSVDYKD